MIQIRPSKERGHADHGWLRSYHTFSFADYYDPSNMNFRHLRVINEDWVAPDQGFGTHPHRDMEIITYVLEGSVAHKDSMGTGSVILPGEVQKMSAGTGVTHSEFNPSKTEKLHLLQIWIMPDKTGIKPNYEQKAYSTQARSNQLKLVGSPDGSETTDGPVKIYQDVKLYSSILDPDKSLEYQNSKDRFAWIQIAKGKVDLNGKALDQGDGAAVSGAELLKIKNNSSAPAEFLLFDLS